MLSSHPNANAQAEGTAVVFADKYRLDFGLGAENDFDTYKQLQDEIRLENRGKELVRDPMKIAMKKKKKF